MISKSIFDNSSKLRKLTGLDKAQFDELCQRIEPSWKGLEIARHTRPDRKRAIGGGTQYKLKSTQEKLLCVLMFFRLNFAYWFLGFSFGLHASNIKRLCDRFKPLIKEAADPELETYLSTAYQQLKRKKISSWEELEKQFPGVAEILIDATEQPIRRPRKQNKRKANVKQRKHYSGKKKRHTRKSQIVTNKAGRIVDWSPSTYGKEHDYKLLKRSGVMKKISKLARKLTDTGYDGLVKDFPKHKNILQPIKRRRGSPSLTKQQKRHNRSISRMRIGVEHVIGRLKQYAILTHTYRYHLKNYDQDIATVAALTNFKLAYTA